MRCFGEFKNDRTCDLCGLANAEMKASCETKRNEAKNRFLKLQSIKNKCKFASCKWDGDQHFEACTKNGETNPRYMLCCNVTLECEEIINEKNNTLK